MPTIMDGTLQSIFDHLTGRGLKSHAYTHSVQDGHHVFLNLESHKFYCLPDNYEIIDQSLEDIVVSCSSSFRYPPFVSKNIK